MEEKEQEEKLSMVEAKKMERQVLIDEQKAKIIAYKGGKCRICGYDKCIDALELHHINHDKKRFKFTWKAVANWDDLYKEADDCILLCCNCHREFHHALKEEKKDAYKLQVSESIEEYDKNHDVKFFESNLSDLVTKEMIEEDIAQGMGNFEGGRKRKISPAYYGCLKRQYGLSREPYNKLKDVSIEDIAKAYKSLGSFNAVARKYGVSYQAITLHLKRRNIPYTSDTFKDYIIKNGY